MKTRMQGWLARVALSLVAIAAWGTGATAQSLSGGNTAPRVTVTADGWSAVINNPRTPTVCAIFIGSTPQPPATREGEPWCQ